ncbi:MAG: hypothetical protein JKY37_22590 [Nannocystaceae bacterium]|nr:hypothetical protein [Nannocystaceae bacterium]
MALLLGVSLSGRADEQDPISGECRSEARTGAECSSGACSDFIADCDINSARLECEGEELWEGFEFNWRQW